MNMQIYETLGFSVSKAKILIGMVLKSVEEFYNLKQFSSNNSSDPSSIYEQWKNQQSSLIEVESKQYEILERLVIDEYWYGVSEITDMRPKDFFSGDPLRGFRERVPFGLILKSVHSANEIYIVLRGTQTKPEWYNNLNFRPGEEGFINENILGKVHSGFHHIYTKQNEGNRRDPNDNLPSMMNVIQRKLENLNSDSPITKIYVTGHSLGAALATLVAAHICHKKLSTEPPILYTFASPRVGNEHFKDYISTNLHDAYRVINSEDIISAVPLASPRFLPEDNIEQIIVESLNTLSDPLLKLLSLLPNLDFYHVGQTIPFTVHKGSILENHIAATYEEALS
jgi:hypothetical protein